MAGWERLRSVLLSRVPWYGCVRRRDSANRLPPPLWGVATPECLLIVDDNPNIRKHTRHLLERETPYSVCGEAVDGLDAIEKARQLHPDLIILGMSMPRMNGLQAARISREMMSEVPIILFTLHAGAIMFSDVQGSGVSSVVSKADGFNGLRTEVETLLESV